MQECKFSRVVVFSFEIMTKRQGSGRSYKRKAGVEASLQPDKKISRIERSDQVLSKYFLYMAQRLLPEKWLTFERLQDQGEDLGQELEDTIVSLLSARKPGLTC